jgi:Abortive infection alpha
MEDIPKTVREVAETAGKAIDAAREAGGFIAKFIGGPLEQGMGIFEDRLKYTRWERQQRLMQRAQEFMRRAGIDGPTRPVPLKLVIPILQGATLEEDDALQDRWAMLLVNAANAKFAGEVRRSYTSILEQLTPLDAHILDVVYALPFDESQHQGVVTKDLPNDVSIADVTAIDFPLPAEEVVISLSNLARLGCLRPAMTWGGGEIFWKINPTIAGKAFVQACSAPRT